MPRQVSEAPSEAANLIEATNQACRKIVPQPPSSRKKKEEKMSDLTTKDLRRDISRVKREVDKIDRAAHGMTFEELIRLLAFPKKGVAADELLSDQDTGQTGD